MEPQSRLTQFWRQLPFFVWLVVLWMLLWGQFTATAAVTGVLVALFVTTWFRLPVAQMSGRVNLWYVLVFAVLFLIAVVRGAIGVAWEVLRPGKTRTAIIRVPLRIDDDLIMTHTAVATSLIPGTTVVEADRERRILYLHAIGVYDASAVDRQRADAQRWEARIVRAVGSRKHAAQVKAGAAPVADRIDEGSAR